MGRQIIACKIFDGIVQKYLQEGDNLIWLEIDEHLKPWDLQAKLQQQIDQWQFDDIILLYGICGNACCGLKSRNHHVKILKIHDCTAALLGSNQRFLALFKDNLSQTWSSANYYHHSRDGKSVVLDGQSGLLNSKEAYVLAYGEDNGDYLWGMLKPSSDIFYLTFDSESDHRIIKKINDEKIIKIIQTIQASEKMIKEALMDGIGLFDVQPYHMVVPTYDFDEIFKIEKEIKE